MEFSLVSGNPTRPTHAPCYGKTLAGSREIVYSSKSPRGRPSGYLWLTGNPAGVIHHLSSPLPAHLPRPPFTTRPSLISAWLTSVTLLHMFQRRNLGLSATRQMALGLPGLLTSPLGPLTGPSQPGYFPEGHHPCYSHGLHNAHSLRLVVSTLCPHGLSPFLPLCDLHSHVLTESIPSPVSQSQKVWLHSPQPRFSRLSPTKPRPNCLSSP